MVSFTPWSSLAGGLLIGVASAGLLLGNGRNAGISSICGGLLASDDDRRWRGLFVLGMIVGGAVLARLRPELFSFTLSRSTAALVIGGLLVGFGTRIGSGCTSGHGLCGLSRASLRSIVATVVFFGVAALTVLAVRIFAGGAL